MEANEETNFGSPPENTGGRRGSMRCPLNVAKFGKREDLRVITPNRLSSTTGERFGDSSEMMIIHQRKEEPKL